MGVGEIFLDEENARRGLCARLAERSEIRDTYQGRPRRSTTGFKELASRCSCSIFLICSSGRRPTRSTGGGGDSFRGVPPNPSAFNRAARPGEGLREWGWYEGLGVLAAAAVVVVVVSVWMLGLVDGEEVSFATSCGVAGFS